MSAPENLFIARTGLQVLSAIEALHAFRCEPKKSVLLLQYSDPKYLAQAERVAVTQEWADIVKVKVEPIRSAATVDRSVGAKLRKAQLIAQLNAIAQRLNGVSQCFTAMHCCNYMRHLLNRIGCRKPILLDEGLGQVNFLRRFLEQPKAPPQGKRSRGTLGLLLGYNNRMPEEYMVFSAFDVEELAPYGFRRHSFENVKRLFSSAHVSEGKYVLWLGTPHFVFGSEEKYVNMAQRMFQELKKFDLPIVYTAHRAETETVLAQLSSFVTVKTADLPVELRLLREGSAPSVVAGMCSTAIPTLDMIFASEISSIVVFEAQADSTWAPSDLSADNLFVYLKRTASSKYRFLSLA